MLKNWWWCKEWITKIVERNENEACVSHEYTLYIYVFGRSLGRVNFQINEAYYSIRHEKEYFMIRTLASYKNHTIISVSISFLFRSFFYRFHVYFHGTKTRKQQLHVIINTWTMNIEHFSRKNQKELERNEKKNDFLHDVKQSTVSCWTRQS